METRKSLKQQITAALSLTLAALAIAVYAPEQAFAQPKMRKSASATVGRQNSPVRPRQIGRRVIMANTEGDFHFVGHSDHANQPNHALINWGDGNTASHDNSHRLIGGLLIPGNAAKAGSASSQSSGNNHNPQVKNPHRYLEQEGIYK